MIFAVQSCPPRDAGELLSRLVQQRDSLPPGPSVLEVRDENREGQLPTMLRVLRLAQSLGQPLTLLEDDVEICADFVDYVLEHWRDPLTHVVSWYSHPVTGPAEWPARYVAWVYPEAPFIGTQACTFSPEFIASFLTSPLVAPFASEHRHDGDELVGLELRRRGWYYALRVPGGVQHLGAESLVMPPDPNPLRRTGQPVRFKAKHYVGRDGRMGGST